MHSTNVKTIIGTQESVYRDLPIGKLEKNRLCENLISPLQQGFHSNSKACLSVTINYLSTIQAFKERIVGAVSFANSTAVATPFACMPTISDIKSKFFIKTSAFKKLPELKKRNSHNLFIGFSAKRPKSLQIFNTNISIVFKSHVCNSIGNFTKSVSNKIAFLNFQFFKRLHCSMVAFISKGLKFLFSSKNLFSFYPDIFPKINLLENFTIRSNDTYSKTFEVDVNPQHVCSFWEGDIILGKVSDNLPIISKSIGLASPTSINQGDISIIVPILLNWDSNSVSWVHSEFNKEIRFGAKGFAVSGIIEFNSNMLQSVPLTFNNIPFNITDNLRIEGGTNFAV